MTKIKVWHVAADTRNGTNSEVFLSEAEAEDWILSQIGMIGCYDRERLEHWIAKRKTKGVVADFWDFVDAHRGDLDTFNLEEKEFDLPEQAPIPPPGPYHVTCPRCGSPNVVVDAAARWNYETQQWELSSTFDERTCDDCGYESHSFDATEPHELTDAQRAVIEDGEDYVRPAA